MSTTISWCRDAAGRPGETLNPTSGCTPVSAGCAHCFAKRVAERFWGVRKFSDVRCHPERLVLPSAWRRPRICFIDSMSDLWHPAVPFAFIDQVFAAMAGAPRHTYVILTKRPARAAEYFAQYDHLPPPAALRLPLNVWLGVSVENQATADERLPILLRDLPGRPFVSLEPLLGPVDIRPYLEYQWYAGPWIEPRKGTIGGMPHQAARLQRALRGCVIGGESGPGYRPLDLAWLPPIVTACQEAEVPVFVKQDSGARPGQQGRISPELWVQQLPWGGGAK